MGSHTISLLIKKWQFSIGRTTIAQFIVKPAEEVKMMRLFVIRGCLWVSLVMASVPLIGLGMMAMILQPAFWQGTAQVSISIALAVPSLLTLAMVAIAFLLFAAGAFFLISAFRSDPENAFR
jgi:fumarate reductase subunit C